MKNTITPARAKASMTRKTVLIESPVSFLEKKNKLVSIYNKNLKEINSNCKQTLHAIFIFESLIKFKYCKIDHINIYIRSGRQKER